VIIARLLPIAATAAVFSVALVGCSESSSLPTDTESSETSPAEASNATAGSGELVSSGFGQSDEYVWVTSLVKNTSEQTGQTVTVSFNVLDSEDNLLATTTQVEAFSTPAQELAVGTQVTVDKGLKAARVEATLDVQEDGIGPKDAQPSMPPIQAKVAKNEYGTYTATYEVVNPTANVLTTVRIGVICVNGANTIIGGGSQFPTLIPASGKIRADTDVATSGKPGACTAYPWISGF